MIWNSNNSIVNFDMKGCAVACQLGEGKPYGNKYLASEGQMGDMWLMKGQRAAPLGKVDDQYLDHTRYDAKTAPNAGRNSDPGGPEYKGFDLVDGKPRFVNKDGKAANAGGTFHIVDGNQVPFDDSKFKQGDEVASSVHGAKWPLGVFPLWAFDHGRGPRAGRWQGFDATPRPGGRGPLRCSASRPVA